MKKCPFCAEEIQDEATKCKHCQSLLIKEIDKDSGMATEKSKQKNKSKTVSVILAIFAVILIIVELQQSNLGFSPIEIGRDIWALLIYVLGGKLIYDAVKSFRCN